MSSTVKRSRVERTEDQVIAAAARLFVRDGYAATTLRSVAAAAEVAERTVYVRFGTKAALFRRVIDTAIAGDRDPIDVRNRPWMEAALSARTVAERIAAMVDGARQIMQRAGDLFAVAQQAAALEPELAAAWQAGRAATRRNMHAVAAALRTDRLIPQTADVDTLADTLGVVCAAETFLLWCRMTGRPREDYERWLRDTLARLIGVT